MHPIALNSLSPPPSIRLFISPSMLPCPFAAPLPPSSHSCRKIRKMCSTIFRPLIDFWAYFLGRGPRPGVDGEGYGGGGWGYGSIGSEDSGYFADVSEEEEGGRDDWGGFEADRARLEARMGGYEPCLGFLEDMRV
ncbi:hypothetical protein L873DRAFT_1794196 [Choiromyces venosus 120613-1]|uniref:Uncharacterized protein n=1 Tax=Choiromyces venosus 120613-1 TaxID=1336337 RepID=A0A3N4J2I6_9PEZI|nr:hypothetical protein L873DRAFT_1794196 [Choiromyces venosus 120613-1]